VVVGVRVAERRTTEGGSRAADPPAAVRPSAGGQREASWPPGVTAALTVEFAVVISFTVAWELSGSGVAHWRLGGLALLACAMGLQSAAVRQLGQVSTTYLTSTLTGVIADLVNRTRSPTMARSLFLLAAVTAGAAAGSTAVRLAPALVPVVLASPVAIVLIVVTAIRLAASRRSP
jgi:Protein of unknown function (DUF1275)